MRRMQVSKHRTSSAWGHRRGMTDRMQLAHIGAPASPETDLANYHAPAQVDPAIAARAMQKLHDFIARGAHYGDVDFETIGPRWYAFRYAEHPADALACAVYVLDTDPSVAGEMRRAA